MIFEVSTSWMALGHTFRRHLHKLSEDLAFEVFSHAKSHHIPYFITVHPDTMAIL